jgi:hypothetical protein
MQTVPRTPPRLITLEHKRSPSIRITLPDLWGDDHPPKRTCRQPLHALALVGRRLAPNKKVRERGEDVVLWRHERDLLGPVLCERVRGVHETRLDHFLSAVRRRQAVLCHAGGKAGCAGGGGQESDVETRVEAAVFWAVVGFVSEGLYYTHRGIPRGVIHSVKGSRACTSAERACCFRKSRKRVLPV